PTYVQAPRTPTPHKPLFAHLADEELLGYGVPAEWLADVRVATEETVLALSDHLPAEAAEALLELATGGTPSKPPPVPPVAGPFDHPDARRRFRVISDVDELADALEAVARRLHDRMLGRAEVASREAIRDLVREAAGESVDHKFSLAFVLSEWNEVVDAWQLDSWEAYRDVARLGRKTRLPEKQREVLWRIFERVRAELNERKLVTQADLYSRLAAHLAAGARPPYDFVVVDEAQDVSVPQLRFVAALGGDRPDALFFAGDLGQRIFHIPFSWLSLGVDIRGRSARLRVNYRTSHQIRAQADRLLGKHVSDVDGNTEERGGTISVFNGPDPAIRVLDSAEEESAVVGRWLA